MTDFAGRKAVVSGATRGIGLGITRELLARGATVIGIYGHDRQAAEALRESCGSLADRLLLRQVDVADHEAVGHLFQELEDRFETLDILVSNAGIRRDALLAMMRPEDWQRVIDVNLTGGYNLSRFAVPLMLKQKYGRIVFITSPMGRLGSVGQANYGASKAGQVGLMRSLAREVARKKITVNCVSPGFIDTDLIADLSEAQRREYRRLVPARRFGTVAEVADAVLFLVGPRAAYINGAVLEVTGGL